MRLCEVASSASAPKVMVPNAREETTDPLFPRVRSSMPKRYSPRTGLRTVCQLSVDNLRLWRHERAHPSPDPLRHARPQAGPCPAGSRCWRAVDAADVVIHAGDWVDVATLDAIEARATRLVAVLREQRRSGSPRPPPGDRARPRSAVCVSRSSTRPVRRTGAKRDAHATSRMRTCWSSATATSRGTRPRRPVCGCSTRIAHRPPPPTRRHLPHGDGGCRAGLREVAFVPVRR